MSSGPPVSGDAAALARAWLAAATRPALLAELDALEVLAADQVSARGPACWSSGRCCHFEAAGHALYTTGLEAARAVIGAAALPGATPLTLGRVDAARAAGGCPFQVGHRCGIHPARPLGCRIYFCDRSAALFQQELAERLVSAVRDLHRRHGVEYRYGEWRGMLAIIAAAGPSAGSPVRDFAG